MQRQVRAAVTLLHRAPKRHRGNPLPGKAVENDKLLRPEALLGDRRQRAKLAQHGSGIRAELDAGAGLIAEARSLQHCRRDPAAAERDRGGQPANAAAGNQNMFRR
jgi:hypothetical protein